MFLLLFIVYSVIWLYPLVNLGLRLFKLWDMGRVTTKEWFGTIFLSGICYVLLIGPLLYSRDPFYALLVVSSMLCYLAFCGWVNLICLREEGRLSQRMRALLPWLLIT